MTLAMPNTTESDLPSEADRQAAKVASRALSRLSGRGCVRVDAVPDSEFSSAAQEGRQTFILPATAVRLLTDMLAHLAEGRSVTVMPEDAELTTQEAADMLNVSRPHLVKLLQEERIPFHKTGTHRRVALRDLLAYRKARALEANTALDDLAKQAQDLEMGY
ncbi:helix-turn-helix domain-containing protein [Roseomonas mucosa]|nr:helix-turn-helix domain-containing protein [Roseomonas mucosa]